MEIIKKNKNIILIVAVVIIGFLAYKYVFKKDEPLTTTESSSSAQILGQDLINELNRLKALRSLSITSTALFNDPVFMSLKDVEVPIQSKPIGRQNPFLSTGI